jgi:ribosome-binding factor A
MPKTDRGMFRPQRIADLIRQSLAHILLQEASDKRFRLVSITEVTVTRDLACAHIYVSLFEEEEAVIRQTIAALQRAAKYFRYQLAQAVNLRFVPELRFFYDDSAARGFKISSLIHHAIKEESDDS